MKCSELDRGSRDCFARLTDIKFDSVCLRISFSRAWIPTSVFNLVWRNECTKEVSHFRILMLKWHSKCQLYLLKYHMTKVQIYCSSYESYFTHKNKNVFYRNQIMSHHNQIMSHLRIRSKDDSNIAVKYEKTFVFLNWLFQIFIVWVHFFSVVGQWDLVYK